MLELRLSFRKPPEGSIFVFKCTRTMTREDIAQWDKFPWGHRKCKTGVIAIANVVSHKCKLPLAFLVEKACITDTRQTDRHTCTSLSKRRGDDKR
jgi:hypothetical protein